MSHHTPLKVLVRGWIAGAAGTAAMTGYQMAMMKIRGGSSSNTPGIVAKRFLEGVYQMQVPDERLTSLTNVAHWSYGTSWGSAYAAVKAGRHPRRTIRHGVVLGTLVWGMSLGQLPALRLAPPPWGYPPKELAMDASYHLVYGLAVAMAYRVLDRR